MSRFGKSAKPGLKHPSQPSAQEVNRLLDCFNRQSNTEGVELARALLDRTPSFGFGWKVLGAMLNRLGMPEDALSAMERAADLMPDDAETHSNAGVMYKALNRNTEAEVCYRRALEISPQAANAHNNLGNLLCEQGKLQEAEQHLQRALELRPEYPDAFLNLGNTFFEQGRDSEAEARYRQCLALVPEHAKAWFGLGLVLSKLGRHAEAVPCYHKVISLTPDNFGAYNNLGVALQSAGQLVDAMRCFEQATRLKPDFVDAYNNLAVAMLNGSDSGNLTGVTEYLQAVLKKTEPQASWRFATLLLIAYQIGGEHRKAADVCRDFNEAVAQIVQGDKDQQSLKAFFTYLTELLLFRQQHPAWYESVSSLAQVEVIGESHCLSPAHSHFTWGPEPCLALPRFIMGIKMHHLARPGVHRMKLLLAQHLSRIGTNSHLLFAIGEIDCRPQEGIWMAAKKGKDSLQEIIAKTVDGYLLWLKNALAGKCFASVTVQGIPAPGNSLAGVISADEQLVFLTMIREVNVRLKDGAMQLGWGFLDVYTATAGSDGCGNKQWHLDGIHLSPGFYQVAQRWRIGAAGLSLSAEQWKNRGNEFYGQGRLDEAVACYRQAIAVDGRYAPPYNNMGSICFIRGQVSEAVGNFRQALALQSPRSSGTIYSLGLALYAAGAIKEAQACFEGALTLVADSWTADAQACLGVIYFLTDQIDKLQTLLGQVKPGPGGANKLQSYFGYLADMLRWRESNAALIAPGAHLDTLHIVGESHALARHGLRVSVADHDYRCQATWVLGCKQWHLAKPGENQYKFQVLRVLESLPAGASVVLAFGEIDCRPDEGIWPAYKKSKGSLTEIVAWTVDGYLNWLDSELAEKKISVVTIQGVPAPGYPLDGIKKELSGFLEMIRAFNERLRNGVLARGWGFLDVYAATANRDGGSHRRWHLDGIHLSPEFYLQAENWRLARCEDEDFAKRATTTKLQIERFGRVPVLLHQLGESLIHLKHYGEALPYLEEASAALAANPDVWNQIGLALSNQQRYDEAHAAYLKAVVLWPNSVGLLLNIASNMNTAQQPNEAMKWLLQASQLAPADPSIQQAMAAFHIDQGRYPAALVLLEDLMAAGYRTIELLCNYANALVASNRSREAIPLLQEALQQTPDFFDVVLLLANTHYELGDFEVAETLFKRAATLNPTHLAPILNQIEIQSARGASVEAETLCRQALALDANHPEAWAALAGLKKNTPADGTWLEKAESLLMQKMPVRQEVALRYACGKFCDDVWDYDRALFHYQHANQLQRSQFEPYVALEQERFVDKLVQTYSLDRCRANHPCASDSSRPLFIVGMPRSGTSLTEQILASHPAVFGAGELDFWRETFTSHKDAFLKGELPEGLLATLAAACLNNLDQRARLATDALRVVDKMPRNFEFIGLIHAIFPNARFLHTMRNPVDTCLSIYFQYFGAAHNYANALNDLAHYYRQYHRLMAHWRSVLPPGVLLDVPYEALVDDQEGWSRKIIEFIGLEWNDACLRFHQTERTVGTASNWQVRQPVYKTSKERWRNYEKYVERLLPLLVLYDPAKGML